MSVFRIEKLDYLVEASYNKWQDFLLKADGSTIFHNPDFLKYHGNKFNEHHLGIFKGDSLFGLLPMAINKDSAKTTAKSPYGGSYGGFIFITTPTYAESTEISALFVNYLISLDINEIIITPPTTSFYTSPCDTFLLTLLEKGFKIINQDITSIIPSLQNKDILQELFSSRARRMIKKAKTVNIECIFNGPTKDFWTVLEKTFKKHGTSPTHTFSEWEWICTHLPGQAWCDVAYLNSIPIAAIGHLKLNKWTNSSFYLCSDPEYQETQAMSLLVYNSLSHSKEFGLSVFDFGTSSVNTIGRGNIFMFKENFGAIGKFRTTYKLQIQ